MSLLHISLQAAPQEGSPYSMLVMMGLLFVVFYFFMIRPQTKKAKEARKFRDALEKGTRVVTIGGMHGKIADVKEKKVMIEVADGVKIWFEKSAIAMDSTMQLTEETAKAS